MARQYQPRRFFRNAPNCMLQKYFSGRNVLTVDVRNETAQDFQENNELAEQFAGLGACRT